MTERLKVRCEIIRSDEGYEGVIHDLTGRKMFHTPFLGCAEDVDNEMARVITAYGWEAVPLATKQVWHLPVGLYPDQMRSLEDLDQKLTALRLHLTPSLVALRHVIAHFKKPPEELPQPVAMRNDELPKEDFETLLKAAREQRDDKGPPSGQVFVVGEFLKGKINRLIGVYADPNRAQQRCALCSKVMPRYNYSVWVLDWYPDMLDYLSPNKPKE